MDTAHVGDAPLLRAVTEHEASSRPLTVHTLSSEPESDTTFPFVLLMSTDEMRLRCPGSSRTNVWCRVEVIGEAGGEGERYGRGRSKRGMVGVWGGGAIVRVRCGLYLSLAAETRWERKERERERISNTVGNVRRARHGRAAGHTTYEDCASSLHAVDIPGAHTRILQQYCI